MAKKYFTGALKNPKDNRDIKFTDLPSKAVSLPTKHITDISMLPVLNQMQLGTCVAHAIVYVKMYQEYKETGKVPKFSRRFLYSIARTYSPYDPNGEGLFPRDGGKVVKDIGASEPDSIDDSTLPHSIYAGFVPTEEMKKAAQKWSAGFVTVKSTDIESIKQAIVKEGLITVSLAHEGSKWNARTGKLSAPKNPTGAHYIAVYGYEVTDKGETILYFINSWSEDWGDKGKGQFNYSEYKSFMYDILVFTDVPNDLIERAKNTQFLFTKNLKLGMTDPEVAKLQERLKLEGFYTYPQITGYFGPVTKEALIKYQKANKITPAEGYFGPITRSKMNEPKKKYRIISESGLQLIKDFEWLHDGNPKTKIVEPMLDPVGYPTIGWGSRYDLNGKEVTMKTAPITLGECDLLLKRDVGYIAAELNKYDLNQNQFDALTSFCYNLGVGAFQKSQIAKNLKSGAPITLEMWTVYSNARDQKTGKLVQLKGLVIRRKKEFALFTK